MAFLVAQGGHRKELLPTGSLVGSEADADIRVLAEYGIAAQHYRIGLAEGGWLLQPLADPGTTSVNGTPVTELTPIQSGDQISAGQLVLVFEDAVAPETQQVAAPVGIEQTAPDAPLPASGDGAQGLQFDAASTPPAAVPAPLPAATDNARAAKSRLPLIAGVCVLLVGAGAATAWKLGVFGKDGGADGTAGSSASFGSLPLGAPAASPAATIGGAHFDLLTRFAPRGSDIGMSLDVPQLAAFYGHWRPELKLPMEAPSLNELDQQMAAQLGFGTKAIQRLSVMAQFKALQGMQMGRSADGFVLVASFSEDIDFKQLLQRAAPAVQELSSSGDTSIYSLEAGRGAPPLALRTVGKRHLLLGSPSAMQNNPARPSGNKQVARLAQAKGAMNFSMAINDDVKQMIAATPEGAPLPQLVEGSIALPAGVGVTGSTRYATPAEAEMAETQWRTQKDQLAAMFAAATAEAGAFNPVEALMARVESRVDGNAHHFSLSVTEGEVRMLIDKAASAANAQAEVAMAQRNAQNICSVFAAALAAGAPDLQDVPDADTAVERLLAGVPGGDSFSNTTFQVPGLTAGHVEAALDHLRWDAATSTLVYEPAAAPGGGSPSLKSMLPAFSRLAKSGAGAAPSPGASPASPQAQRDAQNLSSVFRSAAAAGSKELGAIEDVDAAIELLCRGVYGSEETGFDTVLFSVGQLDPQRRKAASEHLVWEADSGVLLYRESGGQ